jgi:hypothetical protein
MGSKAGRNPPRVQARASGRRSPSLVCDDALMDNDNWIAIMTGFEHTTSSQSTQCPNLDVRNATTVISPGNRRIAHASVPRRLHLRMGEVRSSEPAPRRPHHMQPAGQSTATVVQFQMFAGIARVQNATPDDVPDLALVHFWMSAS